MTITLLQYENIQRYLDGTMPEAERNRFEQQLADDALLNDYFVFEQQLRAHLEAQKDKNDLAAFFPDEQWKHPPTDFDNPAYVRGLIEKVGKEWQEENDSKTTDPGDKAKMRPAGKVLYFPVWLQVAAAACLVIAVGLVVWYTINRPAPPPVAGNNPSRLDTTGTKNDRQPDVVATPPKDSLQNITRPKPKANYARLARRYYRRDSVPARKPVLLEENLIAFAEGDYAAIQNLDLAKLPESRGARGNINDKQNVLELGHYYKGLSFIETGNNRAAIENLQWVIDSAQNGQLAVKAQWYLALNYLRQNEYRRAEPLLKSLANKKNNTPYRKQAETILNDLP